MSLSISPATAAPSAPAPIDTDERLHTLDILRGLALAGMILVHFHQRLEKPMTGAEDLIGWFVWIFVEQKAWGTFAFLFGVGFAVLLRRLEARGESIVPLYLRRLAALALFGIIAQVGLGFHILFEYAYWGLVLLVVRHWRTRTLLVLALVATLARPIAAETTTLYHWWSGTPLPPDGPNLWAGAEAATRLASYGATLAARWALFLATVPQHWRDFLPTSNLTLFILGLLAIRHRVLDEPLRHVRLIAGWATYGVLVWALWWAVLRLLPDVPAPALDWPLKTGFGLVQDQWLTFGYVGGVVLLLAYRPYWMGRMRSFGVAGRMALTNYMIQAAVFDVLGSAYALNVKVRPYVYIVAAPLLFAAQAGFSAAWLARYRFGPLEWLWRCMTYARVQPLRRERIAPVPVVASAT
ncbi:MAG: DUF418 domain-containing protein [Gemmatimonadaceae bacterium]